MAKTPPALSHWLACGSVALLGVAGCTTDNADPLEGLDGRQCAPGPTTALMADVGVGAEVCFDTTGDGLRLFALGLGDDTTVTVTGGRGDTVNFEWDEASAGLFINGVPQFAVRLDGQIVSSPLRAEGVWADGSPMRLSVTWQPLDED